MHIPELISDEFFESVYKNIILRKIGDPKEKVPSESLGYLLPLVLEDETINSDLI